MNQITSEQLNEYLQMLIQLNGLQYVVENYIAIREQYFSAKN